MNVVKAMSAATGVVRAVASAVLAVGIVHRPLAPIHNTADPAVAVFAKACHPITRYAADRVFRDGVAPRHTIHVDRTLHNAKQ